MTVSAIVTLPDGRQARLSGPTRKAVEQQAQRIVRAIEKDAQGVPLLDDEAAMLGKTGRSESRAPITPGFGLPSFSVGGSARDFVRAASNVDDKTSTPLVLGTMGALAFPPSVTASGGPLLARLAAKYGPSILASGVGGGTGGALAESRDPNSTPESVARAFARDGATMAAAQAGGFALGGIANKVMAPNLARYADPMKPVRERIAASGLPGFLKAQAQRVGAALPQTGRVGAAVQRVGRFAASPLGGEALEATVVPAATAMFGPQVGIPLYMARAMFAPGVLQRYLSRSGLPNEVVRAIGRQTATTALGGAMLEDEKR